MMYRRVRTSFLASRHTSWDGWLRLCSLLESSMRLTCVAWLVPALSGLSLGVE